MWGGGKQYSFTPFDACVTAQQVAYSPTAAALQ